ncbi:MAG: copper amine oxidase N-terminal domain-containing protein [Clostridia bacterium]|nr:copper amine oxidase N-terminal domain-containing protein [Clostridia bacterium]
MKKPLITLLILIITLTCSNWAVMAEENVNVVLDGKTITFDVPAQIINGRTMVPIRAIFESMGATVTWHEDTKAAYAVKNGRVVSFFLESTKYGRLLPGATTLEYFPIDCQPLLIDNRILVPARYVAEAFDYNVDWDAKSNTVIINSPEIRASMIKNRVSFDKAEHIELYFTLMGIADSKLFAVSADGIIDISITNNFGEVVYKNSLGFSKDMFDYYTINVPNEGVASNLMCKITIPYEDILPGKTQVGFIKTKISTKESGFVENINNTYSLPLLSQEELKHSIDIKKTPFSLIDDIYDEVLTINKFEITEIKSGFSPDTIYIYYKFSGNLKDNGYKWFSFVAEFLDEKGNEIGKKQLGVKGTGEIQEEGYFICPKETKKIMFKTR